MPVGTQGAFVAGDASIPCLTPIGDEPDAALRPAALRACSGRPRR
jgi:hypothetical protein